MKFTVLFYFLVSFFLIKIKRNKDYSYWLWWETGLRGRELSPGVWEVIIIPSRLRWWLSHVYPMIQDKNHSKSAPPA